MQQYNALIPYFTINGKGSYPDDSALFRDMKTVEFEGVMYWLCLYSGKLNLETGDKKYSDYIKTNNDEPLSVTVTLDKTSAKLVNGEAIVNYTIEFDEPIESPIAITVPISITDRNNMHVDNIGLDIEANLPTKIFSGSFAIEKRGDFTVTDEAINFHESTGMNIINRPLKLIKQPWLRVYQ